MVFLWFSYGDIGVLFTNSAIPLPGAPLSRMSSTHGPVGGETITILTVKAMAMSEITGDFYGD